MRILNKIEEIIAGTCLIIMTILTFANVVSRYLFSASFSFSEEITTYLFVLLSLMGTAIAAKRGAHLGLSIITDAVGPKTEKILRLIGYGVSTIFCGAIFYYGILMVANQRMLGQVTAGMQWSEWIFGSFVPIGAFFATMRFLQVFIIEIKTKPEIKDKKMQEEVSE
ncbi:MAG: TRAP transporter small permease [Suipraeoptans sp.]